MVGLPFSLQYVTVRPELKTVVGGSALATAHAEATAFVTKRTKRRIEEAQASLLVVKRRESPRAPRRAYWRVELPLGCEFGECLPYIDERSHRGEDCSLH